MERRFTRQELYDQVWSKPMSHLVVELGTTTSNLSTLLRRADIPPPSSGYWTRKEFGKPVEPLVLDTEKPSVKRKLKHFKADPSAFSVGTQQVLMSPAEDPVQATPKTRPTMTRDELYGEVWTTPMSRLAEDYGISGNGLAKICDREDIPYPPRG